MTREFLFDQELFLLDQLHSLFQPISLGIFRSDYFIETSGGQYDECRSSSIQPAANGDTDPIHMKQVEMNTMSLGGTTFACLVPEMHR